MPLGRFNSFGNSFVNRGSNFTNPNPISGNPMGGNPFPRQNLFRQILSSPGVQSQMPNLMKGLQQKFMPGLGQGGNSQLFGPTGPGPGSGPGPGMSRQGNLFSSFGQGGGVPPFGQGFPQNQGMNYPGMGPMNNPMQQGNIQPQTSGNLEKNLAIQTSPSTQPKSGGWLQDLLSRLRIGK